MSDTVFKLNAVGSVALVTIDNGEDYRKPTTLGRSAFESAVQVLEQLEQAGITIDDIDLFELNEPFAVQVLTWCDELGVAADDPRLNPYGGAIACGHPLAATGIRLVAQLAYGMRERGVRYGLTALCIGLGMGAAVIWENCDAD